MLPYIEHTQLKQYIKYAREKCHPKLSDKNHELLKTFFKELREESKKFGGMHVSMRQIEGIIRIATGSLLFIFSPCKNAPSKLSVEAGCGYRNSSFAGVLHPDPETQFSEQAEENLCKIYHKCTELIFKKKKYFLLPLAR